jgi:hypothetical protein
MERKAVAIRVLAITGTVLVWLPILAPFVLAAIQFIQSRRFLFDFLMPIELFPVIALGWALLILAALVSHSHWLLICWSFVIAVILLVGGQGLAVLTGLADGRIEARGVWFVLVTSIIVGCSLAVVAVGIGGILLVRGLSGKN